MYDSFSLKEESENWRACLHAATTLQREASIHFSFTQAAQPHPKAVAHDSKVTNSQALSQLTIAE